MIEVNGNKIEFTHFPNGETVVKKYPMLHFGYANVVWSYESDSDFMTLYYIKNLLDEYDIGASLEIRYMPYSRMDRESDDYGFTLKWVSKFINSLKFKDVEILEPHSDVTLALIDNSYVNSVTSKYVKSLLDYNKDSKLFFPDAGAQKRYGGMFKVESLVGFKHRDFKSGEIVDFKVLGNVAQGDTIIIVDDLCSGGRTFLESAKKLKELGASKVLLFVTHCENTIYNGDLLETDYIDHVYTTDSIFQSYNEQKTDKITVFKL